MALFSVSGLWWFTLMIARHPGLLSYWIGDEVRRVDLSRYPNGLPRPALSPETFWRKLRAEDQAGLLLLLWFLLPLLVGSGSV